MKEIIAYEMVFNKVLYDKTNIVCVPFQEKFWNEYSELYNECFYEMRKDLGIEPYNFYSEYSQFQGKETDTFLCLADDKIVGGISCYGNEVDDLFVNKSFQREGWGKQLLLWGMHYIKEQGYDEIILHVAEWNRHAIELYQKAGFYVKKKERIR